jgi:aubergine-like protein
MYNNMESDKPIVFIKRKGVVNKSGEELQLATNFFKFDRSIEGKTFFYKYSVNLTPDIPGDSAQLRRLFWRQVREKVEAKLGFTLFNNTMCYCEKLDSDFHEFECINTDGNKFLMEIKIACEVKMQDPESLALYKRFVDRLVRGRKFINFKKNQFDPTLGKNVNGIEVWPGFNYVINHCTETTLLNLNMIHRVIRPDCVLNEMMKIRENFKTADAEVLKSEIRSALVGAVVLTRYCNDKTYIIDDVDFDMNPLSKFATKDGPVTFMEYYGTKYNRKLSDTAQPLLVHVDKKRENKIYLMPELCFLTGLTDEMRSNFGLMKSLAVITKPAADFKLKEGIDLITSLLKTEKGKEAINQWHITVDPNPVTLKGRRLHAGNIIMQSGSFDALADDIDRKVQQPMLVQPALQDIKIICNSRDYDLALVFMNNLYQATQTFKYSMNRPDIIQVNSNNFKEWENTIRTKTSPQTRVVVLVLSGPKGKGQNYNELKRLLKTEFPIPSQVVLTSTLKKDKGLRSVINKVLIQICAKVGGETWSIEGLPFVKNPTMVMGIDVYQKRGVNYIGCAASYNKNFTQFFTIIKETEIDVPSKIADCVSEALTYVSLI